MMYDDSEEKEEEKPKKIRLACENYGVRGECSATIDYLLKEELDAMKAFTLGSCWIRVSEDGRIERYERFATLPPESEDPAIPPKWIPLTDWTKEAPFLCNPVVSLPDEPKTEYGYPSIIIHGLCGYNNVPYADEARKLQSYGFECMRSRRGRDGKFWELWYLPGVWHAENGLKAAMEKETNERNKAKAAIDFLCRHVSFGAIDLCYQKAAMVIE
ncbi:MAG: hypothetical protein M0R50_08695 [Candidatus Cloacimonetes bacterium]|nr:hypothetical protein [Candidatus Cloacimonadota bacterium]